jgi:hypothetical protein
MSDALDAAAASEPDRPSRSELMRRIVAEWLETRGHLFKDEATRGGDETDPKDE